MTLCTRILSPPHRRATASVLQTCRRLQTASVNPEREAHVPTLRPPPLPATVYRLGVARAPRARQKKSPNNSALFSPSSTAPDASPATVPTVSARSRNPKGCVSRFGATHRRPEADSTPDRLPTGPTTTAGAINQYGTWSTQNVLGKIVTLLSPADHGVIATMGLQSLLWRWIGRSDRGH